MFKLAYLLVLFGALSILSVMNEEKGITTYAFKDLLYRERQKVFDKRLEKCFIFCKICLKGKVVCQAHKVHVF